MWNEQQCLLVTGQTILDMFKSETISYVEASAMLDEMKKEATANAVAFPLTED